jgi:hypothetical protein
VHSANADIVLDEKPKVLTRIELADVERANGASTTPGSRLGLPHVGRARHSVTIKIDVV